MSPHAVRVGGRGRRVKSCFVFRRIRTAKVAESAVRKHHPEAPHPEGARFASRPLRIPWRALQLNVFFPPGKFSSDLEKCRSEGRNYTGALLTWDCPTGHGPCRAAL